MTMNTMKRTVLSGLVALSVAGGSLAPVMAGHAAAGGRGGLCPPKEICPIPFASHAEGVVNGGASGGVLSDGSKIGIGSGSNLDGAPLSEAGLVPHPNPASDASKPSTGGDISF